MLFLIYEFISYDFEIISIELVFSFLDKLH